jgi:hypothetical protein
MAARVGIRPITDNEGMWLVQIAHRDSGSVVSWPRAQMRLLSAQGMPVGRIAEVAFTSPDRVGDARRLGPSPRAAGGARPTTAPAACGTCSPPTTLARDRLDGHLKPRKRRGELLALLRYVRSPYPATTRIAIVLDNASAHLSTRKDPRVGAWPPWVPGASTRAIIPSGRCRQPGSDVPWVRRARLRACASGGPGRNRVNASSGPRGDVAHAADSTASDRRPTGRAGDGPTASRLEAVATVILALAAVATAWSGYQASRWHGEQAIAFSQWVDAYARHETRLADFYRRRFRKEFQPAVAAWIATRPLENLDAPLTPFAMPNYRLEATARAERLTVDAEAAAAEASRDIQLANDYVLAVVPFSAALFRRHQHPPAAAPPTGRPPGRRVCRAGRSARLGGDVSGQHLQPGHEGRSAIHE